MKISFPFRRFKRDFLFKVRPRKCEQGEYWDFSSLAKVAQMPRVEIIWSEIWMNLVFWSEICVNLDQSGCGGGVCVGGWTLSQDRPPSPPPLSHHLTPVDIFKDRKLQIAKVANE